MAGKPGGGGTGKHTGNGRIKIFFIPYNAVFAKRIFV